MTKLRRNDDCGWIAVASPRKSIAILRASRGDLKIPDGGRAGFRPGKA
jgi:hypothetical protein